MDFEMEYIEESLNFPVWKTRFLEGFCPIYEIFEADKTSDKSSTGCVLLNLFNRMINIIKKRLKEEHNISTLFPTDTIIEGQKAGYIENKDLCFEIINYSLNFYSTKSFSIYPKDEYLKLLADFYKKFSSDVKYATANIIHKKSKNIDNLFGLKKEYYDDIINVMKNNKNVKVARIFGSRISENYREFSDIDMIIEGTYTEKGFERIRKQLQRLKIPYFIDIYDVNYRLKPFIYRNTIRSKFFYKRSDYFVDNYISFIEM